MSSTSGLNEAALQSLLPRAKKYYVSDGAGLFVYVHPNGRRYFFWRYRFPAGRKGTQRDYQIGPHGKRPDEWSLKNARAERDRLREILRSGSDPRKDREGPPVAVEASCPTFEQVADDWFISRQDKLKQTTLADYTNKLANQIKPRFAERSTDAIKRADCLKFKEEIAARGAKNNSDKCFMLLRQIFEYAIDREILEGENPARTSRGSKSDHTPKSYPLIKWEEMPEFLATLSNNEGRGNPITVASVKFIFLTAQRVGATIPSRWEEIDWNTNIWTVPAERMKGKEGQTQDHQIPLSAPAIELLKTLEPITGYSGFLFMSVRARSTSHINKESPNAYIKRMGYHGRMVAHSARHAIATFGQDLLTVQYEIIDRHLAHKPAGKVRAAYDHATFWEERVALMEKWAGLFCANGLSL